jgi:hypothetical protein
MRYRYDPEKYQDLYPQQKNVLDGSKIYVLPVLIEKFCLMEVFLTKGPVWIESQHHPIRFGKSCSTKVCLGVTYGTIDLCPKFMWNGNEWILNTYGTFFFSEMEFNEPIEKEMTITAESKNE